MAATQTSLRETSDLAMRTASSTPADASIAHTSDIKAETDAPLSNPSPELPLEADPTGSTTGTVSPAYSSYSPYAAHDLAQYTGFTPQHAAWTQPHAYFPPGLPYQVPAPAPTLGTGRPGQQFAFVPLPGAQQHKRPRRKFEEIERMYKCGYEGCEKAYGTLNHLNAHVTMQGHGIKRVPEEIRKEWKQRKKEEESQRKNTDDRVIMPNGSGFLSTHQSNSHSLNSALQSSINSAAASINGSNPSSAIDSHTPELGTSTTSTAFASPTRPHLPSINYAPSAGPAPPPSYGNGVEQMFQNGVAGSNSYIYPPSPFGNSPPLYLDRHSHAMTTSSFTPSILTYGHPDAEPEKESES